MYLVDIMKYVTKILFSPLANQQFCSKIVGLVAVCLCFLVICCSGCQFPYKIDPSGNCLFVKNENANSTLPEFNSPFTSPQGLRPNEPAVNTTVPATPAPEYQSSIPGIAATPGTASGISPSASSTGVLDSGTTRGTLLVPGSGPIVLTTPDEQIALIGSEVILFANYKGDDDYLRVGERIEWSLGGVGHIQTTNTTQCSNILTLDFNKDKKVSDRYAVTSTLHYEGTIDRGSADEQGKIPHLAGQSWISIQSAEEGTSTVTAFAPTIKDWNRRTSSATVHWVDAEWVYPRADITKYSDPKIFMTQVKKRSSGAPCPNWIVRYEVVGGPSAGLGPNNSKVLEVPTDAEGKASIEFYLLEGNTGTSTVKATIIRPAGVDGGTKRLELHSANLTNYWSAEAPLSMRTNPPPQMRWGEQAEWTINIDNRSDVTKTGVVTLPLPSHVKLLSSVTQPSSRTPQADGGELVAWNVEFRPVQTAQIKFVLQAVSNDPALNSQQLELELNPTLTMFPRESGQAGQGSSTGSGTPDYGGGGSNTTFAPDSTLPTAPAAPPSGGFQPDGGYGNLNGGTGGMTTPSTPPATQGNSDPAVFANKLQVVCKTGAMMTVNKANKIAVEVTNNATTPFYQGVVLVEVPDGLLFVDENDRRYDDNNGNVATSMEFRIGEVSIPQGKTETILFNVRPTKAGNFSIKATVWGQSQSSGEWFPISNATHTASPRVTGQ